MNHLRVDYQNSQSRSLGTKLHPIQRLSGGRFQKIRSIFVSLHQPTQGLRFSASGKFTVLNSKNEILVLSPSFSLRRFSLFVFTVAKPGPRKYVLCCLRDSINVNQEWQQNFRILFCFDEKIISCCILRIFFIRIKLKDIF